MTDAVVLFVFNSEYVLVALVLTHITVQKSNKAEIHLSLLILFSQSEPTANSESAIPVVQTSLSITAAGSLHN